MKIGLALGGGGAKGAAHVGVLMALEELGIRPSLITGTSAGAYVGATYAAGVDLETIAKSIPELALGQLYGLPGMVPALSTNIKYKQYLRDLIGDITFADLKIPLAVVATDLISQKEVILDEGEVVTAVMASASLPLVFPPIEIDGMALIDGGVMNNVPFDVARARGATYVIAVDLSNSAPFGTVDDAEPPPHGLLAKAIALTKNRRIWQIMSTISDINNTKMLHARLAISRPEILLRPYLGTISLFDTHRWQEAVEAGKTAVYEVQNELKKLVK
ncbi:MAG: patatin-like phospholipase family protein [Ardenticatenaceae bacterium]|nr:patatin-like phospholipase family protein [Ardenticatenaceae bacterium]